MDHVSGLIRAAVEAKICPGSAIWRWASRPERAERSRHHRRYRGGGDAEPAAAGGVSRYAGGGRGTGFTRTCDARRVAGRHAGLGDRSGGRDDELRRGNPVFGTILAYVVGGEIKAGWIHDPINNVTVTALLGGGAWCDGKRLEVDKATPLNRSAGSAYWTAENWLMPDPGLAASGLFGEIRIMLLGGGLHRSGAWPPAVRPVAGIEAVDHAAGVLITREAGGFAGFLEGADYSVTELDSRVVATATEVRAMRVADRQGRLRRPTRPVEGRPPRLAIRAAACGRAAGRRRCGRAGGALPGGRSRRYSPGCGSRRRPLRRRGRPCRRRVRRR